MRVLLFVLAWIAVSIPIAMLVGKAIAGLNPDGDEPRLPLTPAGIAPQTNPNAGFVVRPVETSARRERRMVRNPDNDQTWAVESVADGAQTRLAHYRVRAERLREMAEAESIGSLRANLLNLAARYDRIAAGASAQRSDASARHGMSARIKRRV